MDNNWKCFFSFFFNINNLLNESLNNFLFNSCPMSRINPCLTFSFEIYHNELSLKQKDHKIEATQNTKTFEKVKRSKSLNSAYQLGRLKETPVSASGFWGQDDCLHFFLRKLRIIVVLGHTTYRRRLCDKLCLECQRSQWVHDLFQNEQTFDSSHLLMASISRKRLSCRTT